jgi:hypothetical protein
MRREPTAPAVAVLAALLLVSGCGVPTTGPTTRVDEVNDDAAGPPTAADDPLLPTSNAAETIEHFLGAAAGDWSGRDERLNTFVAGEWKWSEPEAGDELIRVPDNGIDVNPGANTTTAQVDVSGDVIGSYLPDGQVEPPAGDRDFDETFTLERDDPSQDWQLVDPPEQVLLLDSTFAERYETRSLYFPAKGDALGTLVPDPRWIPNAIKGAQERYTLLTEWLLNGPSEWLAASVDSAFPRGTVRKSVSADRSDVTVDVSSESASQELGEPEDMSAQLAWSLGLGDSQRLSLLVDGQERLTEPVSNWRSKNRAPAADTVLSGLVYFLSDGAVQASDPDAPFVSGDSLGLSSAALEPGGDRLAATVSDETGQRLIQGTATKLKPIKDFTAGSIEDPQWFSKDKLMVLADGAPTVVKLDDGPSRKVTMSEASGVITDISLSPDSRRLAYVADGEAWVAPVTDVDGLEVHLGEPHRVGREVTGVRDLGWSQETRLLMIGSVSSSDDWLWEVSIDNAYRQAQPGARDSGIADSLAVRCAYPKDTDEAGQPIAVAIGENILRVYSEGMSAVPMRDSKDENRPAVGTAPFTQP